MDEVQSGRGSLAPSSGWGKETTRTVWTGRSKRVVVWFIMGFLCRSSGGGGNGGAPLMSVEGSRPLG